MPEVSVLIPYRSDGRYRDMAFLRHVRPRWQALQEQGFELIVQSPVDGKSPAEFNHPAAINAAAARAKGEIFLIADADTTWAPDDLPARLVAAVHEGAPWAMPRRYATLTLPQSRKLVTSISPPDESLLQKAGWVGDSVNWSGLVCVPRAGFDAVKGYDERYEFWGADDVAFGLSLDTLHGAHVRVEGSCLHLWHPTPLDHNYGHRRNREQAALTERYKHAAGDWGATWGLRAEEPGAMARDYS